MKYTIMEGSGILSGKRYEIIPWTHPEAQALANHYPFVGGRTPQSMRWIAVRLTDGSVDCIPKSR